MSITRTTIMLDEELYDRVLTHLKKNNNEESITEFTRRAFLNQLENDGDFEIRDMLEEKEV